MEKHKFIGKSKDEAIQQAKISLEESNIDNLFINELSSKKSLFSTKVEIEVIEKEEIIKFTKEYIQNLLKNMGFNIKIEVFNKNNTPLYKIYSDNDSLLIGKNGKNLKSLQILVGQAINKEINQNFKFTIDINDYQEKKERNLIRLAKNIAREVSETKVEAKLDSMNSYERRIIHNALANSSKVYTESCGEEPERYVVIKLKGE